MKTSYLIARLIATVASVFYILLVINYATEGGGLTNAGIVLIVIVTFMAISTITSWVRAHIGAILLLISGTAFLIFSIIFNSIPMAIIMGGPFILAAIILGVRDEIRAITVLPKREITTQE
jgi:hypothetical protein